HAGDDVWSTFHADSELDNPVEIECDPESDLYDVVLELTSTGATMTLEARDTLNCDPVCFVYERTGTYACKGANKFRRVTFSGTEGLDLPLCVCVTPAPPGTCVSGCDTMPTEYRFTLPEDFGGGHTFGNPCCPAALGQQMSLVY